MSSEGRGRGSELVVRLPARDGGSGRAAADRAAASGPARRVLVVDDNADAADSLRMLLDLKGHDARAVHDGPAALERMREFDPEVVLLDLGLPGMDGIEVARRIRAQPGGDRVLLVAVTGWGQEEDRQRTREVFDEHLTKPVDAGRLIALLEGA